jgi:hypothetical protein
MHSLIVEFRQQNLDVPIQSGQPEAPELSVVASSRNSFIGNILEIPRKAAECLPGGSRWETPRI